jgi:virginiamycin A acetyltransferase
MNSLILSGVHIGDGAIIGAYSVVTKDVKPYTVVAGNPAKVVRKRFDQETIDELLRSNGGIGTCRK